MSEQTGKVIIEEYIVKLWNLKFHFPTQRKEGYINQSNQMSFSLGAKGLLVLGAGG